MSNNIAKLVNVSNFERNVVLIDYDNSSHAYGMCAGDLYGTNTTIIVFCGPDKTNHAESSSFPKRTLFWYPPTNINIPQLADNAINMFVMAIGVQCRGYNKKQVTIVSGGDKRYSATKAIGENEFTNLTITLVDGSDKSKGILDLFSPDSMCRECMIVSTYEKYNHRPKQCQHCQKSICALALEKKEDNHHQGKYHWKECEAAGCDFDYMGCTTDTIGKEHLRQCKHCEAEECPKSVDEKTWNETHRIVYWKVCRKSGCDFSFADCCSDSIGIKHKQKHKDQGQTICCDKWIKDIKKHQIEEHDFQECCKQVFSLSEYDSHMLDQHQFIKCPLCESVVNPNGSHFSSNHKDQKVPCSTCKSSVKGRNMSKHMNKVHPLIV